MALLPAPSAEAFARNGPKWEYKSGYSPWCVTQRVVDAGWTSWVSASLQQYNDLGNTGQPTWNRVSGTCQTDNTAEIRFGRSSYIGALCGLTYWSARDSDRYFNPDVRVNLNTRNAYWGITSAPKPPDACHARWSALHEFGHSQGLDHNARSGYVNVIMWPRDNNGDMLKHDDRKGIQCIYYPFAAATASCIAESAIH